MNKKDKEFVSFMEDRREASQKHYEKKGYLKAFKRFDQLWNRILPDEIASQLDKRRARAGELSKLVPPTIFRFHRDLTSRVNQAFRMAEPNFRLIGRSGEDDALLAERNEQLVHFNFEHDDGSGNFAQKRKRVISDALKYGIGILHPEYSTQYIHTPQLKKGSLLDYEWNPTEKFQGVHYTRILPQRFRPDPYATNRKELRYFTYDKIATIGELWDKEEELELKNLRGKDGIDPNGFLKEKFWEFFPESKDSENIDTSNKKAVAAAPVLLTYYFDGADWGIYANRETLIWHKPSPDESRELPIILGVLIPKDDELVGKSMISVIEDDFYEQFHKRNTRLDKQNTSVAGSYKTTDPKLGKLKWIYGGGGRVIQYSQGYEFDKLDFIDTTDTDFREEQHVVKEMQDSLNLSDISMGLSPQRQERATTAAILNENASVPMQDLIEQGEETILKPAVMKTLQLLNQFLPIDFEYRIIGRDPVEMDKIKNPREEIRVNWDIICRTAGEFESRVLKRQSMGNFAMSMLNFPNAMEVNWHEFSLQYGKMFNLDNIDKILPDPESLKAYPRMENYVLTKGMPLPVQPTDNDQLHLEVHQEPMQQMQQGQPGQQMQPEQQMQPGQELQPGQPEQQMAMPYPALQQHILMHQQQYQFKQGQQQGQGGGASPSQEQPAGEQDMVKVAGEKVSQGKVLGGGM